MYIRKNPYTEKGIKRLKCIKCGKQAIHQWYTCSLGRWIPICSECDIDLNIVALIWIGYSSAQIKEIINKYIKGS